MKMASKNTMVVCRRKVRNWVIVMVVLLFAAGVASYVDNIPVCMLSLALSMGALLRASWLQDKVDVELWRIDGIR